MAQRETAREIKARLESVFLASLDTIEEDLKELQPKERLDILAKLIPYVLPKSAPLKEKVSDDAFNWDIDL